MLNIDQLQQVAEHVEKDARASLARVGIFDEQSERDLFVAASNAMHATTTLHALLVAALVKAGGGAVAPQESETPEVKP